MAAVAARATLADRIKIPYPILLVVSGLALAFVNPGVLPQYRLDPEGVFVLFLPPLLFSPALFPAGRTRPRAALRDPGGAAPVPARPRGGLRPLPSAAVVLLGLLHVVAGLPPEAAHHRAPPRWRGGGQ